MDDDMRLSSEYLQGQEEVPEAVRKKQELRGELAAQLERLKADVARLETWARTEPPWGEPDTEAVGKLMLVF
jgi:hypothetical protein